MTGLVVLNAETRSGELAGDGEEVVVALALAEQDPAFVEQVGLGQRAIGRDTSPLTRRGALVDGAPGVGQRRASGSPRGRPRAHPGRERRVGASEARTRGPGRTRPPGKPANRIALASSAAAVASGPCTSMMISRARRRWPSACTAPGHALPPPRRLVDRSRVGCSGPLDVGVGHFHPVLEELYGEVPSTASETRLPGLAELVSVRAEQQRPGEGVRVPSVGLPDRVDAGQDVPPLVGAADLQLDLVVSRTGRGSRWPAAAGS